MPDQQKLVSWNADEVEVAAACPACGAKPTGYRYQGLNDYLEQTPGSWCLRDCNVCGSLFLDPRPTLQSVGKAYASYYTHGSAALTHAGDNGRSLFWKLANGYMNTRYGSQRSPALQIGKLLLPLLPVLRQQLDFFYRHLPHKPGRLLDVGCGNGVFLLRARAAGWAAVGVEPDPLAAESARQSGLDVHAGTMESCREANAFDVITSSHVIEHVHDPGMFLRQIYRLLRVDGVVWLATPNVRSMGHRRYGRVWRGLEPPRHITVFSARALHMLLVEAGFSEIRFHRRGRGASYILDTSRKQARHEGMHIRALPTLVVDLWASMMKTGAEELVVTARKSRQ